MSRTTIIIEILKSLGIYAAVKEKADVISDEQLATLFDRDFEKLIAQVQK